MGMAAHPSGYMRAAGVGDKYPEDLFRSERWSWH
jgi:hypothetical protein